MSDLSEMTKALEKLEKSVPDNIRARHKELEGQIEKLIGSGSAELTLKTDSTGKVVGEATEAKSTYGLSVSLSFEILDPPGTYPSVSVMSMDTDGKRLTLRSWTKARANERSSTKVFSTSLWKKTKFVVKGDAGEGHANSEIRVKVFYSY